GRIVTTGRAVTSIVVTASRPSATSEGSPRLVAWRETITRGEFTTSATPRPAWWRSFPSLPESTSIERAKLRPTRGNDMTRAEFESELRREGYEVREGEIEANTHREAHAHGFDARVFVLDGSITLVFGEDRFTYGPGDSCSVPAGTMHEEHTDADGVRYIF